MLHSRATAALERLKQMDRKYKIKLKEGKSNRNNVSTESSLENTPKSSNGKAEFIQTLKKEFASKMSPKSKVKTEIVSSYANDEKFSNDEEVYSKKTFEIFPRRKMEFSAEVEMSKDSASRTEEFLKTISNPESVTGGSLKSSSEIQADISGFENPQDEEFSVPTIFSKRLTAPETISEAIKSRNSNVMEKVTIEDNLEALNHGYDEMTIDEVIRISDEKSETISELPNALDKDSIEGEDSSNVSSADEQKLQYENTFEEVTNSTASSSSTEIRTQKSSEEALLQDTVISGVKQIKITSHKQEIIQEKIIDDEKDKEIVELIAPKIIKSNSECDADLDEELSNYVKTTENEDEVLPINLLRLSKQTTPTKKHARKCRKHRKSSKENIKEKAESPVSDEQRLTKSRVNKDDSPMRENSSSAMKSVTSARNIQKESPKAEMTSLSREQAQVECIEVEKEAAKSETEKLMKEPEIISSEKLLRETPKKSDVTSTLRELNKDAINAIVRKHRIQATSKISDKSRRCKNCKAIVKLPSVEYETPENIEDNESISTSQENIRTHSSHRQRMRVKRSKSKRISKGSKARKVFNQGKMEETQSRFDCRQTRHLQKQAAALRMQQEREDIRNYLLELQCTQLEFGPGETGASSKISAFKPLEFPKILGFKKPDLENLNLESTDAIAALQEKILTIRQWLKDQYLLYRDYSKLAQTVNAKYVPASLEDAKRTIRQLQRATI